MKMISKEAYQKLMSCFVTLISEQKYTRYSVTKTILLNSVDLVSFILLCIYLLHIDNYDNVIGTW